MSNALATDTFLAAIATAVRAAWSNLTVDYDDPPRLPLTAPYAIVSWNDVDISFSGPGATVSNPSQTNIFTITGRFPFPSDPTQKIALQKITLANALIAQLQTAANFTSYGFLPLVTKVSPGELDDPNEKVFELTLTFQVQSRASHH